MDVGPLRDALTAVVGIATGVLSGAFGVGGEVVSTPGIRLLGVPALTAVGTTLPSILPTALAGAHRYRAEGLISWNAVVLTVPTGMLASVAGGLLSDVVPGDGHPLMIITAVLLGVTAVRMGRPDTSSETVESGADQSDDRSGTRLRLACVGVLAGAMSGLLGVGGGLVMVPAFHQMAKMSIKSAIGTSLACVALFAIPGTITHALLGHIDWRVAGFLTLTVIPSARLGSTLALRTSDARLRRIVAYFLGLIAIVYAAGEITALITG